MDVESDLEELWTLYVDGSSNVSGVGAMLILTNLEGDIAGYSLCFKFSTTNNEAKYEALIAGLKVAREVGAQHLKVFSDSQLIVWYIKDGYEIREEYMKKIPLEGKGFDLNLFEF